MTAMSSTPNALLDPELVRAFDACFVNRHDTFCLQMADGAYRRQFRTLTLADLLEHLSGQETIAAYALDRTNQARWVCFDSDAPDGLEQLAELQRALADLGVASLREASRRGGHLWVLCASPQPAQLLRGLSQGLLVLLQARGQLAGPIELYPDSDLLVGRDAMGHAVGHAVRLPLGIHQVSGRIYPFLDGTGRLCHRPSVPEALRWLVGQPRVTRVQLETALIQLEDQLEALLDQVDRAQLLDPLPRATQHPPRHRGRQVTARAVADGSDLIGWANACLSLPELIAETHANVQLRRSGRGWIGWCPWHEDQAPQADGRPGTPSLYVVRDRRYGWSWRCLSTNCGAHSGPMHHTFDWLIWCAAGHIGQAVAGARQRYQRALSAHTTHVDEQGEEPG